MQEKRDFPSFSVYDEYRECDWCGVQTRGLTYYDEPAVVYCTSCHVHLEGNPHGVIKIQEANRDNN